MSYQLPINTISTRNKEEALATDWALEERLREAKEMISGLLERMGVKASVECRYENGNLHLDVTGDEDGMIIGKKGRTLDAIETLMNRMVNRTGTEPIRIVLDVDRYRKRREENLTRTAHRLAKKAKGEQRIVTIGPLCPRDRRVIHLALAGDPGLRTESVGEGEMKKLRIIPLGKEPEGSRTIEQNPTRFER